MKKISEQLHKLSPTNAPTLPKVPKRRWGSRLFVCIIVVVFLVILTPLTLYIPSVQRRVCDEVVALLNDNPHQLHYEVGGISLSFPLRLKVTDVVAYRGESDTLFYMKKLVTGLDKIPVFQRYYLIRKLDISDLKLYVDDFSPSLGMVGEVKSLAIRNLAVDPEKGKLRLGEVDLVSANVAMRVETIDKDTLSDDNAMPWHIEVEDVNLRDICYKLKLDGERLFLSNHTKGLDVEGFVMMTDPLWFQVDDVRLPDASIRLDMDNYIACDTISKDIVEMPNQTDEIHYNSKYFDYAHMDLQELGFRVRNLYYGDKKIVAEIDNFSVQEKISGLLVDQMSASSFQMDSSWISVSDLVLNLSDSYIRGDVSLDYKLFFQPDQGNFDIDMEGRLSSQEVVRQTAFYVPAISANWPDTTLSFVFDASISEGTWNFSQATIKLPNYLNLSFLGHGEIPTNYNQSVWEGHFIADLLHSDFLLSTFVADSLQREYFIPDSCQLVVDLGQDNKLIYGDLICTKDSVVMTDLTASYLLDEDKYQLTSLLKRFPIGEVVPSFPLRNISARFRISGKNIDFLSPQTSMDADVVIDTMYYQKDVKAPTTDLISDLHLSAQLAHSAYNIAITMNDTLCNMQGRVSGVIAKDSISADGLIDVDRFDLKLIPSAHNLEGEFSLNSHFALQGNMKQDYSGILKIDSILHKRQDVETALEPVSWHLTTRNNYLSSVLSGGDCNFSILAECGLFDIRPLYDTVKNEVDRQMASWKWDLTSIERKIPRLDLRLDMYQDNPFYPFITSMQQEFSYCGIRLNNDDHFSVSVSLDDYGSDAWSFDTIRVTLYPQNENVHSYKTKLVNIAPQQKNSYSVLLGGEIRNDSITGHLSYTNFLRGLLYDVGLNLAMRDDTATLHLSANPIIYGQPLIINPDNYLRVSSFKNISKHGIDCSADVRMTGPEALSLSLFTLPLSENKGTRIRLDVNHLDLSYLGKTMKWRIPTSGVLDFNCIADVDPDSISCRFNVETDHFVFDNYTADSLMLRGRYSNFDKRMTGYVGMNVDGRKTLFASMAVDPKGVMAQADSLSLKYLHKIYGDNISSSERALATLTLSELPLSFLNVYMPSNIRLDGALAGRLSFRGEELKQLQGDGFILMDTASIYYDDADAKLRLSDDTIWMNDNQIKFQSFPIYSGVKNTPPLLLSGKIDMVKSLTTPNIDLRLSGEHVELFKSKKRQYDAQTISGTLPLNVNLHLSGEVSNLALSGNVTALAETDISYYLQQETLSGNSKTEQLVEFVSFDKLNRRNVAQIFSSDPIQSAGFHTDIRIDVARTANAYIALSPNESDNLYVTGGGALRLVMPAHGALNLNGSYEVSDGSFTFKLPMLPMSKSFKISDGGMLQWNGTVDNPELNLTATEEIRCTINDESGATRVVKFVVYVKIGGTVQQMTISFDCAAPEDASIQNQINSLTDEERSKQALKLLVTQTYSGPGVSSASSVASANAALTALLQKEVESLLNQRFKNTEIAVGIDTYDVTGTGSSRTDYSVKVSQKLLNDRMRVVIGGRVSSGDDISVKEDNAIINDFSLEWLLREDGSRYLRLFRKTNYESILEGEIVETGLGYVVQRSSYRLRDLFNPNAEKRRQLMLQKIREMDKVTER